MKSRRPTSDMGLPPLGQAPPIMTTAAGGRTGRSHSQLAIGSRQVLGLDLNRSESRRMLSAPSALKDSTLSAAEACCAAGFESSVCRLWVKSGAVGRGDTSIHVRSTPNTDHRFNSSVPVTKSQLQTSCRSFDHLVGAQHGGIVPFCRLLWCSTCVVVGSTPAVDV
jgi:hypothetical protein